MEVADGDQMVGVRSSLAPGVALAFPVDDWRRFVTSVKNCAFDAPTDGAG